MRSVDDPVTDELLRRAGPAVLTHVKLAEARLEIGDGRAALAYVEKALAIDPLMDYHHYKRCDHAP